MKRRTFQQDGPLMSQPDYGSPDSFAEQVNKLAVAIIAAELFERVKNETSV